MPSHRNGFLVVMVPLALSATVAFAQAGTSKLASAQIDELKQVYLACDRTASRQPLDMALAAYCSTVAEVLQKRAFDDNFDRLLAWWRAEKESAESAQPTAAAIAHESH
jgi:hypothetical protein